MLSSWDETKISEKNSCIGKFTTDSNPNVTTYKFDAESGRELFAQIIMKHDLPILFPGYEYFLHCFAHLCPIYNFCLRNTLEADYMNLFKVTRKYFIICLNKILPNIALPTIYGIQNIKELSIICSSCFFDDG